MVKDLRQICKDSAINASVFHPYFVFFDQFELVRPTSIQSMVIGALIMMLISFIFIPNFLCSLWVAFSIVSIELGVAGYMSLWDVNLDSISMINLIMCIGFSVDFTAHICYTYMSSKATTPDERVREALYGLGLPIVQGACSTILSVIALLLADSYIFLVFFKMVFLVILFGAMHGLFLLPVLLSLFGPGSWQRTPKESKKFAIDQNYPYPYCITRPQLALGKNFANGKTFLSAPYKSYGEDKDLGLGTSGEDSSESSSSKSQRRQAIEDQNTRRRYQEGWRRSSHNLSTPSASQFQPVIDLYGHETDQIWTNKRYDLDDLYLQAKTKRYNEGFEMDDSHVGVEKARRKSDESRTTNHRFGDTLCYESDRSGNFMGETERRRLSEEEHYRRQNGVEAPPRGRMARRYSPPEGIYRQNPNNRSSSQHNLYYTRHNHLPPQQPLSPQKSSSHSNLRHLGDIRFP